MEIVKFKKDKGNYYKVYFDDDTVVKLHDDVIVKYNLLSNKILDNKKFDEIINYNDFLSGYYKSIHFISIKQRSEREIRDYLKKMDIKSSEIESIVDLLYKDGFLNKEKYMISYINDKYNLSNDGPIKVRYNLINIGYKEDLFKDYLYSKDWNIKIKRIIEKRIKQNHKLSNNAFKTKILVDLGRLGYEKCDIIDVLNLYKLDSDYGLLNSLLPRVKNKYSKKYSGNELKYKVESYLYSKGYNIEDIRRCYDENEV